MGFNGTLLSFPDTGKAFPNKYIEASTFSVTPAQRSEVQAYRDADNYLHRVTSSNTKVSLSFNTVPMNLADMIAVRTLFNEAFIDSLQRKIRIRFWDDEIMNYKTAVCYMPDTQYTKEEVTRDNIRYAPVTFEFIEY